jgi:hypothetical protein
MSPSDRVAQIYPQAPGSLFVAFYDSQGYGGGILTRLHTGTNRGISPVSPLREILKKIIKIFIENNGVPSEIRIERFKNTKSKRVAPMPSGWLKEQYAILFHGKEALIGSLLQKGN